MTTFSFDAVSFIPLIAATSDPTQPTVGFGAIFALVLFILASMWIGALANRATREGSFMKGFFLGNRGLGAWALALTATVQSGGTFMGFPSMVYSYGWIVALWISGYMVVPLTGFAFLGKRLAQLSRKLGAITVPDMFRERFRSPTLGLIVSLFILFYMSFMMVAQFKAGAIVMKLALPGTDSLVLSEDAATGLDMAYFFGLAVFTVTVVGYTMLGGFLAAVWTDLFQSVMMFIGVVALLFLALQSAGGLEQASRKAVANVGPGIASGPGYIAPKKTSAATTKPGELSPATVSSNKSVEPKTSANVDEKAPANAEAEPSPSRMARQFLPPSLALSFFCVWVFSGLGSPAGMVRVMASEGTEVIRKSIYLLSIYNLFIYLPLIIICICGRALMPDLPPGKSDEIIPRMALSMTEHLPLGSFWGGLILAAPFGAVMATVSSYLVVIASGLVRDVYQRFINPQATQPELRRLSYIVMMVVGAIAVIANIRPVAFLQSIVVFSGTGAAATFCVPALMAAYWRRATVAGSIASMIGGAGFVLVLYILGFYGFGADDMMGPETSFKPYFMFGFDPILWGLLASLIAGVLVSLATQPPEEALVSSLFDAPPPATEATVTTAHDSKG